VTAHRAVTAALGLAVALTASAQAPLLQDGARALRQARLDWTLGEPPLPPSTLPFLEVGLGGADAGGTPTPLLGGEGFGPGSRGWGLGLQGRYAKGAWSLSATVLALRDGGHTRGALPRAALAYQTESGWRAALEQAPFAWGAGLLGGDLLGDNARAFPRVSLATPEADLPLGRWRLEAFTGRLEREPAIPAWLPDQPSRLTAQASGLNLRHPRLSGLFLRAALGPWFEAGFGTLRLAGDSSAPPDSARSASLVEARVRVPAFARLLQARGASLQLSRGAAPDGPALTLSPARDLGGLQVAWEAWDLAVEYAGAAPRSAPRPWLEPALLAGFSTHGDPLGPAFGRDVTTRTVEVGLPFFLEGRSRLRAVRATSVEGHPSGGGSWFLQAEAQWRTATGRAGGALSSRRNEWTSAPPRWGWAFSVFQAFRVF
jgi:hypothetical protein